MIWLAVAGLVVAIAIAIVPNLPGPSGSATSSEPGSGAGSPAVAEARTSTQCPAPVATWLPGGGSGAVLVAGYITEKHVVTICRDGSGQLFYDGLVKGAEANSQTHISLRATATATGFIANNKSYVYEIDGSQLILSNGGREIYRTALTRTGP